MDDTLNLKEHAIRIKACLDVFDAAFQAPVQSRYLSTLEVYKASHALLNAQHELTEQVLGLLCQREEATGVEAGEALFHMIEPYVTAVAAQEAWLRVFLPRVDREGVQQLWGEQPARQAPTAFPVCRRCGTPTPATELVRNYWVCSACDRETTPA